MTKAWYVLRSKPNKEDALFQLTRSRGFKVYYPRLRVKPKNPRSRHVRPFFPGYMFIHIDFKGEGQSRFNWLPHSRGLVAFGNDPGRVPDSIILAMQKRVDEINSIDPDPFSEWKHGDKAVIREGAFEGFEAIFDRGLSGKQRARVLMKFLSGQWVRTEVDVHLLEKRSFVRR